MSETTTKATERIAAIPVDELLTDFHEASKDLQAAEIAVKAGEVQYRYRIDGNKKQLQVIQAEIKRRIEAGKELLTACKEILPYLGTQTELLNYAATNDGQASGFDIASVKIRAAIAKAGGR